MASKKHGQWGWPSNGEVLVFICDCFGMPVPDMGGKQYTTLARLRREGGDTKRQKIVEVTRRLGNELAKHIWPGIGDSRLVDRVLAERRFTPEKFLTWPYQADGTPEDLPGYLMIDLIDFMERYDDLTFHVRCDAIPRKWVLWALATQFAIPFLAIKTAAYKRFGLMRGVPWGRAWYLPQQPHWPTDNTITWPVNHVLESWEELLGKRLTQLAYRFDPTGRHLKTVQRELHKWRTSEVPPDVSKIEMLSKVAPQLEYPGSFELTPGQIGREHFEACCSFLAKKLSSTPDLENEIGIGMLFPLCSSTTANGTTIRFGVSSAKNNCPTEESIRDLVQRVARRYARPTQQQLRAKLLLAVGFQNVFRWARDAFGKDSWGFDIAWRLVQDYWAIENNVFLFPALFSPHTKERRELLQAHPDLHRIRLRAGWLFESGQLSRLYRAVGDALATGPFFDENSEPPTPPAGLNPNGTVVPVRRGPWH